jgi:hypothetical protein
MRKQYFIWMLPLCLVLGLSFLSFNKELPKEIGEVELVVGGEVDLLSQPLSSPMTFNEPVRKDTQVLLTVDTKNISESTIEEHVVITDDREGAEAGGSAPSEHIAVVDRKMKIYWRAETLDPQVQATVDVLGIFRKPDGGAEILDGVFRDPNKDGVIMGKIKDKRVEGLEHYNIMIRINEETPRTFVIDPKLRMN